MKIVPQNLHPFLSSLLLTFALGCCRILWCLLQIHWCPWEADSVCRRPHIWWCHQSQERAGLEVRLESYTSKAGSISVLLITRTFLVIPELSDEVSIWESNQCKAIHPLHVPFAEPFLVFRFVHQTQELGVHPVRDVHRWVSGHFAWVWFTSGQSNVSIGQ